MTEAIPNLETLVLTNNMISELSDVDCLTGFEKLTTLSLLFNPVSTKEHYRLYTIYKLPSLRLLDFRKVKLAVSFSVNFAQRVTIMTFYTSKHLYCRNGKKPSLYLKVKKVNKFGRQLKLKQYEETRSSNKKTKRKGPDVQPVIFLATVLSS